MIPGPTLELEQGFVGGLVCGVDEAGRGPLAGPVAAGAVILDLDCVPAGLNDSKKLSAARREALELEIIRTARAWAVGFASVEEISQLNILQATGLAMRRAVAALSPAPVRALVDGNYRFALPCEVVTLVGGDGKSASIAAASILAKVARDRIMIDMDARYPGYGFERHKGYGTATHLAALAQLGPCDIHRRGWGSLTG